ncbi:beta-lactamase/transpeptidase-like protein [Mycena epipterygia]|nr:beta-lactamase/transpeptidase-like protein [Mycena epipterygia]
MQLIEQGKIELDTYVEQMLPELANPVVLLNHTSRLDYSVDRTIPANYIPLAYSHIYQPGEGISTFFKITQGSLPGQPLRHEPGTDFSYGFCSDCAGFIVERLSGKSLEQYFQEYIFAPLGIKSASFYLTPSLKERLLPLSRYSNGTICPESPVMDLDPANGFIQAAWAYIPRRKTTLRFCDTCSKSKAPGRATNPILTLTSVNTMFEPSLPPAGAVSMNAASAAFAKHVGIPTGAAQFGRGLLINTADIPGKRKKNSGTWGGWACT